jgi:hypothetical protein
MRLFKLVSLIVLVALVLSACAAPTAAPAPAAKAEPTKAAAAPVAKAEPTKAPAAEPTKARLLSRRRSESRLAPLSGPPHLRRIAMAPLLAIGGAQERRAARGRADRKDSRYPDGRQRRQQGD